jgi:hypothetical protein
MAAKDHDKITLEGKQFFKQMKELKKLQVRVRLSRRQSAGGRRRLA